VNCLELLLQVELALVLEQRAAHFLVELALEAEQLDLARQYLAQSLEQLRHRGRFEQRLASLHANREVGGNAVRLPRHRVRALHYRHDLVGNPAMECHVFLEQREDTAGQDVHVRQIVRGDICLIGQRRAQMARRGDVPRYARARHTLYENARGAVGQARGLDDSRNGANAVKIPGRRFLGVGATLRDQEQQSAFGRRRLDRSERSLAANDERHGDERKYDDVAERENGEPAGLRVGGKGHLRKIAALPATCP
jgi:hypothetical protein